jgi:hypothetical protein
MVALAFPRRPKHEVEDAGQQVWSRIVEELDKHDTSLRSLYGDGWSAEPLDQREFQVLTVVSGLGGSGKIGRIFDAVTNWAPNLDVADVFLTLERLEKRELITGTPGGTDDGSRTFQTTEDGERALRRAHAEGKQLEIAREDLFRDGCPG